MNSLILKDRINSHVKLHHLVALYQVMIDNNDKTNAAKILELYEKLEKKELLVSFAGHFSAGKSSMINSLFNADILPKSPIPTSATIVKLTSGEGVARVYFHHDQPVEYNEPYDIDMIKDYSKDRDAIRKIEISTSESIIPIGCSIMDTPGIDAADDADRLMTLSSMYLVDALFYVMDYNHVQSEVNMQFLQSLQEKSIPFYVIVNQIDKHDEEELPFTMFDTSIKQTFDQWGIEPKSIFYSSLLNPSVNYNQFEEIKDKLFSIMYEEKEQYFSIERSINHVINEHKVYLKTEYEDQYSILSNTQDDLEIDFSKIDQLENKINDVQNMPTELEKDFQNELQNTLKNAYLMPSDLRDKATSFLESQQHDFKVGLLGSKKKTADERKSRLNVFLNALQASIDATIQWKLRDKFTNLLKQYEITDPNIQKQIQELTVIYSGDELIKLIKPGAKLNGDYVLHYTNDVSTDIKNSFKQKARNLKDIIRSKLTDQNQNLLESYNDQLHDLTDVYSLKLNKDAIQAELEEKFKHVDEQLDSPTNEIDAWEAVQKAIKAKQTYVKGDSSSNKRNQTTTNESTSVVGETGNKKKVQSIQSIESVIESVKITVNTVEDLPGFQGIIEDLKRKQNRLANRSYTIALFGAFSAGKSSFANALLGEKLLPVSPNPTTATVNRISPVTDKHKHGTVIVTIKDDETLSKDLAQITKNFKPEATDFKSLLQWVQTNGIHQNQQLNKMYQSYLQAMITGYEENKEFIGKTIEITLEDFAEFVTDETKACYAESIDLYYDCALTRQGITLVDTPGADSVNARHTNVAFDYIKHADAILYVTYYNHALSRADKDFLTQLGRVKDTFQLDKMFFIINASDLAKDDGELRVVTNYVQEQLIQLGIRFPRLYPLSSKQALEAKQKNKALSEQMATFEENFNKFIHNDLTALTTESTIWDIKRTYDTLQHYLASANLGEKEKGEFKRELFSKKEMLEQLASERVTVTYEEQISQKIDKQLYYVLERLGIRFHDMFKEAFNPTTITESGKKAHVQLHNSLQNLLDYIAFELLQELQAVSLRIESHVTSLGKEVYNEIAKRSNQVVETFILPNMDPVNLETPTFEQAFRMIDTHQFDRALSTFKGTKSFFEKNEKEVMKDSIYDILKPIAQHYIDENRSIMDQAYLMEWNQIIEEIKMDVKRNITMHIDSNLEMLSAPVNMNELTEKNQLIESILKKYAVEEVS
ncbi:dynamin family protein [Virgibacillus tibetensis]